MDSRIDKIEELTHKLHKVESEFQDFFHNAPDLICVANNAYMLEKINPAWSRTLGYSEKEILERPYLDLVHPDDLERTRKAAHGMKRSDVKFFRNRYKHKEGHYITLEWSATTYNIGGKTYAIARVIDEGLGE